MKKECFSFFENFFDNVISKQVIIGREFYVRNEIIDLRIKLALLKLRIFRVDFFLKLYSSQYHQSKPSFSFFCKPVNICSKAVKVSIMYYVQIWFKMINNQTRAISLHELLQMCLKSIHDMKFGREFLKDFLGLKIYLSADFNIISKVL